MKSVVLDLKKIFSENSEKYELLKLSILFSYSDEHPAPVYRSEHKTRSTKIYLTERDCLEASAVISTIESNGRPLVLNMANSYNCGGSFHRYGGSQEEYLFRNTSLVASLWPHRRADDHRWPPGDRLFPSRQDPIYYPFTNCGGVYSPHVQVFNFPHICSIISLAQQDLRKPRPSSSSSFVSTATALQFDYDLTLQNLRSLFSIAASNGHTALILGAIGCGAFRNPPKEICRAFAELLLIPDSEFFNVFETIIFAIIKSPENLSAFEEFFGPSVELESVLFPEEEEEESLSSSREEDW
jgi:uncharacterized protein (TIGR02452 family)